MPRMSNVVFDIGTSEGNDTAYYLEKGFNVVSVEADPVIFKTFCGRFASAIDEGRLSPHNCAVYSVAGEELRFWRNEADQGVSSLSKSQKGKYTDSQTSYLVKSIDYPTLIANHGIPHYCKIDVEGAEAEFLKSIETLDQAPRFISAEVHKLDPVHELKRIGYKYFKLVDQRLVYKFPIPNPPLEGTYVANPQFRHASGPFGRELPGPWVDYDTLCKLYMMIEELRTHKSALWSWYDCHAWNGDETNV